MPRGGGRRGGLPETAKPLNIDLSTMDATILPPWNPQIHGLWNYGDMDIHLYVALIIMEPDVEETHSSFTPRAARERAQEMHTTRPSSR